MPVDRTPRNPPHPTRDAPVPPGDQEALRLHDARDIRALAHPARLAIIDALASGDELTATECAELTGLSPSATAYHLKLLDRYGLVEPATPRSDGRQRPWRAAARRNTFDLDPATPAGAAAASAVMLGVTDSTRALAETFLALGHEESAEWQDAASLVSADLWLTVEEARGIADALAAAVDPYRTRSLSARPSGTRRVRVLGTVVPHPRR